MLCSGLLRLFHKFYTICVICDPKSFDIASLAQGLSFYCPTHPNKALAKMGNNRKY